MQTNRGSNRSWFQSFRYAVAVTVATAAATKLVPSKWANMSLHVTRTRVPHKIILHAADVRPAEFISLDPLSYRESSLISEPAPATVKHVDVLLTAGCYALPEQQQPQADSWEVCIIPLRSLNSGGAYCQGICVVRVELHYIGCNAYSWYTGDPSYRLLRQHRFRSLVERDTRIPHRDNLCLKVVILSLVFLLMDHWTSSCLYCRLLSFREEKPVH